MSDSLSFKYTITEEDFFRTLRAHALKRIPRWMQWILFAALLFVAGSAIWYIIDRPRLNAGEIVPLMVLIIVPIFFVWSLGWGHPKRVARDAPYLNVEIEGTASGDGIVSRSRLGNHETAWGSYSTVFESADHFLLYLGRNVFSPFPKRAFTDPKDIDRFRDLIRAHVPNARLLDRREK